MNRYARDKINIKAIRIDNSKNILIFTLIIEFLIFIFSFDTEEGFVYEGLLFWGIVFVFPSALYFIFSSQKKIHFKSIDKDILILSLNFLKLTEESNERIRSKLELLFEAYPKKELHRLFAKYAFEKPEIYRSCKNLADYTPQIRYFAIYSLMDMASADGLFTLVEEEFMDEVRSRLKIHSTTFQYIKNTYLKKGLQEERKILEEQARKAYEIEFVPFNAYKVLGLHPKLLTNN